MTMTKVLITVMFVRLSLIISTLRSRRCRYDARTLFQIKMNMAGKPYGIADIFSGRDIYGTTTFTGSRRDGTINGRGRKKGEPAAGMDRAQRRAYKARVYAAKIDSLVQSRDYMFFPNSMQQLPGGMIRSIYADYFFFGVFVDHVEVHLPTERGITQYVEMLNFDSMSVRDYRAARVQWGWSVSFNISDGNTLYHADFAVSTATGETVLTLLTPDVTMRYVGWLWNKRVNDPRYRRMD